MAIKRLNKGDNTDRQIKDTMIERANRELLNIAAYIGEKAVEYARKNGSYKDQTGNLRSSIGYAVVHDKKVILKDALEKVKNGVEGVQVGNQFRNELIEEQQKKGISTIVLAGMDYAAAVESTNRDVISGSELMVKKLVPELLRRSGFNVKER